MFALIKQITAHPTIKLSIRYQDLYNTCKFFWERNGDIDDSCFSFWINSGILLLLLLFENLKSYWPKYISLTNNPHSVLRFQVIYIYCISKRVYALQINKRWGKCEDNINEIIWHPSSSLLMTQSALNNLLYVSRPNHCGTPIIY